MPLDSTSIQRAAGKAITAAGETVTRARSAVSDKTLSVVRTETDAPHLPDAFAGRTITALVPTSAEEPAALDLYTFSLDSTAWEVFDHEAGYAGWRAVLAPTLPAALLVTDVDAPLTGDPAAESTTHVACRALIVHVPSRSGGGVVDELVSRTIAYLSPAHLTAAQLRQVVRNEEPLQLWTRMDGTAPTEGDRDQAGLRVFGPRTAPRLHRDAAGTAVLLEIDLAGGGMR